MSAAVNHFPSAEWIYNTQQNFDLQERVCRCGACLRVEGTHSRSFFKYSEWKPSINCNRLI